MFTTPAFDRLIRDKKPRVTLGVSLAGNLVNLTVDSGDLPARELASLLASYRKRKKYHRLRDGMFLDLQDFDLSQLDRPAADLGLTAKELAAGSVELPAYRAFYLDEEADLARDRSFTRYVEGFRAADERAYDVPPALAGVLRPYQAEGFRWLSARCDAGFGGVLADRWASANRCNHNPAARPARGGAHGRPLPYRVPRVARVQLARGVRAVRA